MAGLVAVLALVFNQDRHVLLRDRLGRLLLRLRCEVLGHHWRCVPRLLVPTEGILLLERGGRLGLVLIVLKSLLAMMQFRFEDLQSVHDFGALLLLLLKLVDFVHELANLLLSLLKHLL